MPQSCAVPFCSEKKGGHKFPKDENVSKQWLIAIRRDNYTPSKHSRVCKKHFNPDDYALPKESYTENPTPKLKPKTVPSRFSWNHESEERKEIKRKRAKRAFQHQKKCETATLCSNTEENQEHFVITCCSCRGAIPAAAALFRCVQCAGRALLCARCLPHEHRHRDHCLMRLPSTRVHRVLEGIFQTLRLDVNELLSKEDDLKAPDQPGLLAMQEGRADKKGLRLDIASQLGPVNAAVIEDTQPTDEDNIVETVAIARLVYDTSDVTIKIEDPLEVHIYEGERKRKANRERSTGGGTRARSTVISREPHVDASVRPCDASVRPSDVSVRPCDASVRPSDASVALQYIADIEQDSLRPDGTETHEIWMELDVDPL